MPPTDTNANRHRVFCFEVDHAISAAIRTIVLSVENTEFHLCGDPERAIDAATQFEPTLVLLGQDSSNGMELLKSFRRNPSTKRIPIIVLAAAEAVKADAFANGANDFLEKLPPWSEFVARIRYHSSAYINLLERDNAFRELAQEFASGRKFLETFLPDRERVPFPIDYRFVPCAELGGDMIQCHRLEQSNYAIYLLDVSGHGLSSAFLAATIINVIRSNMLESVDLAKPADVLTELNRRFPMEKNNGKYFTIWYGVYNTDSRQLTWAVAGHPSALLAKMTNGPQLTALGSRTFAIGMVEDTTYDADQCVVEPGDRLYLYSDGVVDIHLKTGGVRTSDEFVRFVRAQLSESRDCVLDRVHANANELSATTKFKDDFSILELRL